MDEIIINKVNTIIEEVMDEIKEIEIIKDDETSSLKSNNNEEMRKMPTFNFSQD